MLTQMCALRYGALPVVAHVAGLADTVVDAIDAAVASGVATDVSWQHSAQQYAKLFRELVASR